MSSITSSSSSWQQTLIDEESSYLRSINEGYRTWCLRHQKIQLLQKQLDTFSINQLEQAPQRLEMRVQQLKAMTLGHPVDSADETTQAVLACEAAIVKLSALSAKKMAEPSSTHDAVKAFNDLAASSAAEEAHEVGLSSDRVLDEFREQMHTLDLKVDEIFESKYAAEFELKEFEQSLLKQWQDKKQAAEYWTKRHAALTGMRSAMRAALQRHELRPSSEAVASGSADAADVEDCGPHDELQVPGTAGEDELDGFDVDDLSWVDGKESCLAQEPNPDVGMHALSDVLAEGVTDPKEREEILKREHAGSAEHPHGCRPCHFQGGLCWKGLACSFCHICPKPKRKSKHQRDVDKRRQERYKQVKDDLGIPCFDELTKIDDARRQIMTSSEELKKRVKDAYASKELSIIMGVRDMVNQMKTSVDSYHSTMPFFVNFDDDSIGAQSDSDRDSEYQEKETTAAAQNGETEKAGVECAVAVLETLDAGRGDEKAKQSLGNQAAKATEQLHLPPAKAKAKKRETMRNKLKKGSGNETSTGGQNREVGGKGWNQQVYGWGGKTGPAPMDFWYAQGPPLGPYPPRMYHDQWWDPNMATMGDAMWTGQNSHPPPSHAAENVQSYSNSHAGHDESDAGWGGSNPVEQQLQ